MFFALTSRFVRVAWLYATLWVLSPRASRADETCPAGGAQVAEAAQELQRAFFDMDDGGLARATERLQSLRGCVADPVSPLEAANVHVALALAAFASRARSDEAGRAFAMGRTRDHLRAALETDPTVLPRLCSELSEAHPLCELVREVQRLPVSPRIPASAPPWVDLFADGRIDTTLPTERDALTQIQFDGEVCWSDLHRGPISRDMLAPCRQARQVHRSRSFFLASGAAGGVAVGMLALSLPAVVRDHRAEWQGEECGYPCTPLTQRTEEIDARYDEMKPLFYGGLASAGLAFGLGSTGLVLRW